MESNRRLTSNFANPIGFGLLFILAALFFYFGLRDGAVFLLFFALLFLLAWLWNRFALSRLEITVSSNRLCAFPGSELTLSCRVLNRKFLPLIWLELLLPLPKNQCIQALGPQDQKLVQTQEEETETLCACTSLSWLLWHQESVGSLSLKAVRRGIHTVSHLYAASGDGFGLAVKEAKFPLAHPLILVVYPEIFPVSPGIFIRNISDQDAGQGGYLEDITLLKMNRPYQPGDPAKKIGWRQLAGQTKLMANIYETVFPQLVTFYLDLPSFRLKTTEKNSINGQEITVWKETESELELMLCVTASCILHLQKSRILCGLIIPGEPGKPAVFHSPKSHGADTGQLLFSLAAVSYHGEELQPPGNIFASHAHAFGSLCVITRSYESMACPKNLLAPIPRVILAAHSVSQKDSLCPWKLLTKDDLLIFPEHMPPIRQQDFYSSKKGTL